MNAAKACLHLVLASGLVVGGIPAGAAFAAGSADVTAAAAPADVSAVQVNRIVFEGNASIDAADLLPLVQDALGRKLTLTDLQALADRITQAYRARGFLLAGAYVPAQQIDDGTLRLAVVEGDYGRIQITNASVLHSAVVDRYAAAMRPGEPVTADTYQRSVLLLGDLPGIAASAALSAGAAAGTTDVALHLDDEARVAGTLALEAGDGAVQTHWTALLNDLRGVGDQLTVGPLTLGTGTQSIGFSYRLPVGGRGLAASFAYSADVQSDEPLPGLAVADGGQGSRIDLAYPLVRTPQLTETASLAYNRRVQREVIGGLLVRASTDDRVTASLSSDGTQPDGGATSRSAALTLGSLGLAPAGVRAQDAAGARTAGMYARLNLSGHLTQPLSPRTTFGLEVDAQLASKNLDASSKLSLGGPSGVRAFAAGAVSADQGLLARLEWNRTLTAGGSGPKLHVLGYFDAGVADVDRFPWPGASGAPVRLLAGAGWGLQLGAGPISAQLLNAYPVGTAAAGERGGRWWFSGSVAF